MKIKDWCANYLNHFNLSEAKKIRHPGKNDAATNLRSLSYVSIVVPILVGIAYLVTSIPSALSSLKGRITKNNPIPNTKTNDVATGALNTQKSQAREVATGAPNTQARVQVDLVDVNEETRSVDKVEPEVATIRFAADLGDPESQYKLGKKFLTSNVQEAAHYLQLSADNGYLDAQALFGSVLATGFQGIEQDVDKGAKYLRAAAIQGDGESMFHLGEMYEYGQLEEFGGFDGISIATQYYEEAAKKGNEAAKERLAEMNR